ncbi:MAG TPA: mechanosensitive ion channel domain-containing protein, partial [Stellaceae bacterium]|nr:mechanosensitive ion channel domain-containing protein [Stellaceae bacterium]
AEWLLARAMRRPIKALQTIPARWAAESETAAAEEAAAQAALDGAAADGAAGDDTAGDGAAGITIAAKAPVVDRKRARAWRLVRRIPRALGVFVLDLLPLVGFLVVAYIALGVVLSDDSDETRLATLTLVYAYVVCRIVLAVTRLMVSPATKGLRLIRMSDQSAAYTEVWVRRIIVVAAFGVALADVAVVLGLYPTAHAALVKIVMLVVHLFIAIVILQCRQAVANAIRADLHAHGGFAVLRNRLGDLWHYIAIFFVLALWVVWAFSLRNGYTRLVHFSFVTLGVLVAARLIAVAVLGAFDKGFQISTELSERYPGLEARANRYYPLLRSLVSAILGVATLLVLLQVWGIDAILWFLRGSIGGRLISAIITIAIAASVAVAVWEISNAAAERHLARLAQRQEFARSARLRTLLPMLRTALFIVVVTVLVLTILSEIGVNIAPLLASAGIVGIAIGFGSQKLVQDLITGLFLLLEDAMQVGDTVTLAGLSGVVEHLSIRTIRLRAGDGSVHIIPFSSVTTVTNTNRGVGNAAVSVAIAYGEDTDRVGEVMKAVALEMREDDAFKDLMLSDLQLWGVDKVEASTVTMVGQIVCKDTGRWGVQREYNRRLKRRFQEEDIEIANPTQTIVVKTAREAARGGDSASHSAGNSAEFADGNPANVKESPPPSSLGHDR